MRVLAIDPGRDKCGLAVVEGASGTEGRVEIRVLIREIVARGELSPRVEALARLYTPDAVVVGNGTGSEEIIRELKSAPGRGIPEVCLVDEYRSSEEARIRYLIEHKPRGLLRLLPISLRYPDGPYDDYVAVILAERFILTRKGDWE